MNQIATGRYIAQKRKEQNLTQEQLGERLRVSNKTVSKWENGKCMPDYSIIESVCKELDITIAELMAGEDAKQDGTRAHEEEQILDLLKITHELEKQKKIMYGILLIVMGVALLSISYSFGGTSVKDFLSGFLMGLSIVEMLTGVYVVGRGMAGR